MVRCSTPSQTREEDWAEQIETDMVNRTKSVTPTVGKRPGTHQESLAEGGAIMPDQVAKKTRSNVGIVENLATMKRSAERRNESLHQPIINSRTMLQIPTMKIIVECS